MFYFKTNLHKKIAELNDWLEKFMKLLKGYQILI